MKIKRIEHVAVAVKKLEPTMALLEDLFGFKLEYKEDRETARLAMYPFGETYVELVEGKSGMPAQWFAENGEGLFHLCFEVDDIDAALVYYNLCKLSGFECERVTVGLTPANGA